MIPFKIVHHWPGWVNAIYCINHISKHTYFTRISNNIDTIFNDGSVQLTNVSMIEFYSPVVIKLNKIVKRFDWPFHLKTNFTSGSWSVPFPRDEIPFSVIIIGYLVELYLWWKYFIRRRMLLKVHNNLTCIIIRVQSVMLNCTHTDLRLAKMILKSANLNKQFPSIQAGSHCYSFHKYLPTKTFQYRINKDNSQSLPIVPGISGMLYSQSNMSRTRWPYYMAFNGRAILYGSYCMEYIDLLNISFWLCSYNDLLQESRQHQHLP